MLIELQDKVETLGMGSVPAGTLPLENDPSAREQAEEALVSLGYKSAEASRLLDKHAEAGQSVEQMIRAALRGAAR